MSKDSRMVQFFAGILFGVIAISSAGAEERALSLWTLEHDEAKIYLLGSIHVMKPDMYPLAEPILMAFAEAEKVVFEVDLTKLDAVEAGRLIAQKGLYTSPRTISHDLQPETMALLKDYLEDSNLQMDRVERLKPWYLMVTIAQMELARLGYESEYGIDQYLQKRAVEEGKPILQLETFAQQIEILSGDSMLIQDLSLRASLAQIPSFESDLQSLIDAWRRGAADQMIDLALASARDYPELTEQMSRLIFDRNEKMAHKIREYAATSGTYLVVVGALHMGGDKGLVRLLDRDFAVKQLTY